MIFFSCLIKRVKTFVAHKSGCDTNHKEEELARMKVNRAVRSEYMNWFQEEREKPTLSTCHW